MGKRVWSLEKTGIIMIDHEIQSEALSLMHCEIYFTYHEKKAVIKFSTFLASVLFKRL